MNDTATEENLEEISLDRTESSTNRRTNDLTTINVQPIAADEQDLNMIFDRDFQHLFNFILTKTKEYQNCVVQTSPTTFAISILHSQIATWTFANELTRIYRSFGMTRTEEFEENIRNVLESPTTPQATKESIINVAKAFEDWDQFLRNLDSMLGPIHGDVLDIESSDKDEQLNEMFTKHHSLQSFAKDSKYSMLMISVVASFSSTKLAEQAMKIHQRSEEFIKNDCGILLLTKEKGNGGSFLKIAGIPFEEMTEEEEIHKLIQRKPAIKIAGSKTIHAVTELICVDDSISISDGPEALESASQDMLESVGGIVILNELGEMIYMCSESVEENWPDVDSLLEIVKSSKKLLASENCSIISAEPKMTIDVHDENETDVAESTRKPCCSIL